MKKTKKRTKVLPIVLGLIVIVILVSIVIAKTGIFQKHTDSGGSIKQMGTVFLEIVSPEEEPNDEKRAYAPAEIINVFQKDSITYLTLDMLTINKDFKPGVTDFFINQNPKLRDFAINNVTKAYNCGKGTDGNETTPDVSTPVETVIAHIQQILTSNNGRLTYYFDLQDNKINTIYEQCLP